jgi:hypothetical protein
MAISEATSQQSKIGAIGCIDGPRRKLMSYTNSDLEAVPSWNPTLNPNPPLSITKAIDIVRQHLLTETTEEKRYHVTTIEMLRLSGDDSTDNKWCYRIGIRYEDKQDDGDSRVGMVNKQVVVLMSGHLLSNE